MQAAARDRWTERATRLGLVEPDAADQTLDRRRAGRPRPEGRRADRDHRGPPAGRDRRDAQRLSPPRDRGGPGAGLAAGVGLVGARARPLRPARPRRRAVGRAGRLAARHLGHDRAALVGERLGGGQEAGNDGVDRGSWSHGFNMYTGPPEDRHPPPARAVRRSPAWRPDPRTGSAVGRRCADSKTLPTRPSACSTAPRCPPPEAIRDVYLIGICGKGMGALAELLAAGGLPRPRERRSGLPAHVDAPRRRRHPDPRGLRPRPPRRARRPPPDLVVVGNAAARRRTPRPPPRASAG